MEAAFTLTTAFSPSSDARPLDLRAPFVRRLQVRREKELSHTTWLTNCDWADSSGFCSTLRSTCAREVKRYRSISFGERFRILIYSRSGRKLKKKSHDIQLINFAS